MNHASRGPRSTERPGSTATGSTRRASTPPPHAKFA